jgi:hypothetical protein
MTGARPAWLVLLLLGGGAWAQAGDGIRGTQRAALLDTVGDRDVVSVLMDVELGACLDAYGDLRAALDRLWESHARLIAAHPAKRVWIGWAGTLGDLSDEQVELVFSWFDSPERTRRRYFCEDGFPREWRGLPDDELVDELLEYLQRETQRAELRLRSRGEVERRRIVGEMEVLADDLLARYEAQSEGEIEGLQRLRSGVVGLWERHVELYDPGPEPLGPEGDVVLGELRKYRYNPFVWHDPADLARRDRIRRSWRRHRRALAEQLAEEQALLDAALRAALTSSDPDDRARMAREMMRAQASLEASLADLARFERRVAQYRTGDAILDTLLDNGVRRSNVRKAERLAQEVVQARNDAVETLAVLLSAPGAGSAELTSSGTGSVGEGQGSPGSAGDGADSSAGAGSGTAGAAGQGGSANWDLKVYQGRLPPPGQGWSPQLIAAIQFANPSLDETDVRLLLSLISAAYGYLNDRAAIEGAVWRSLAAPGGWRLSGAEGGLSELYDARLGPEGQAEVRFELRLLEP